MSTTSTVSPQAMLPALLTSAVQAADDGTLHQVAVLGRLAGPDMPLTGRQELLQAGCVYLQHPDDA